MKSMDAHTNKTIVKRREKTPEKVAVTAADSQNKPLILAPVGNKQTFLAAVAAGADAIYCGLKQFSARMAAINFTMEELAPLAALAREKNVKLLVTVNTLIKPEELDGVGQLMMRLDRYVKPDALIVQDLAVVELARQIGFSGEIHLSTLTNSTFPEALKMIGKIPEVRQVIIPRELHVDEVKKMAAACPSGLGLEIFVHGALCYGVSGRCYWSSYLGGKSGLRGRCVQPCRRFYTQGQTRGKFFSCLDLSVDVLVKILLDIPQIRAWKIEGRKKGVHYVYYTASAYKLLRDHGRDTQAKKDALWLLERSLGRPGMRYFLLPQRPLNPISKDGRTGSGLFVGKVQGAAGKAFLVPREALFKGDVLRIGYEDESWHGTHRVGKAVPKHGRLHLNVFSSRGLEKGTPVFLVDRMEPKVKEELETLSRSLPQAEERFPKLPVFRARLPGAAYRKSEASEVSVFRYPTRNKSKTAPGYWLSPETVLAGGKEGARRVSWWLPPVIWPDDENAWEQLIGRIVAKGGRRFVLNAPWQTTFFKKANRYQLWAGPFCNASNSLAITELANMGFSGAIISPELAKNEILLLPRQSPIPLGIVVSGHFPACISRIHPENVKIDETFKSPRGEEAWVKQYGSDYWIYSNWRLDLTKKRRAIQAAGYQLLVHLNDPIPKGVKLKKRPGLWNWEVGLP